ncbi:MAG TPA: monovalent cation/H(+) antiporter subunit G [Flavobacteriaceae bacterium]|nr:monovalent cation/H(+) antiporter subunit G [Flavobacteriaceae bacterium]
MSDIIIAITATAGVLFILLAAIGFLKMPDAYLRMAVTTKASTLGSGLILLAATLFFADSGVTSRVIAIILFLFLTVPVGAHLIARAAYFIGVKLWKGTIIDEMEGKYDLHSHELHSEENKDE